MVKCGVLFEVRTGFLNVIYMSFGCKGIISLNSVNQLIFVMVRCGVLFEVRTEFLNVIQTSFVLYPNSKLILHASHAALPILISSKLPPVVDTADLIVFEIIDKTIRNSKFRCLSEATPYYHNVFTFTLFLPEGRAGVAWEPSNKMMLFLPTRKIKCLSHFTP
jgi:hypothetical protein